MTTIRIEEGVRPLRASRSRTGSSGPNDGIYNIRALSRASSVDRQSVRTADADDEDPGLRQSGDYKQKQVHNDDTIVCGR